MGRLDRAMRRAAEEGAAGVSGGALEVDLPPSDFPSESPVAEPARRILDSAPEFGGDEVADDPGQVELVPETGDMASRFEPGLSTKTVVDNLMMPAAREQYRRLAAALHQAQQASGIKVVMVASAMAGEGKTLTAVNLALTLSESYRRNVLLVDADLRRPSVHSVFQISGDAGLTDTLASADPKLPLHQFTPRLTVLPAGMPTSDPMGVLTSERMRRLVEEAREAFDWVIVDTPPIGLLTDASLLVTSADGVVLVIKAEVTPYDMVNRAIDLIGRERLVGVVLNRATELPHREAYDYSKYYYGRPQLPEAQG